MFQREGEIYIYIYIIYQMTREYIKRAKAYESLRTFNYCGGHCNSGVFLIIFRLKRRL
jgi:hypothetical protein